MPTTRSRSSFLTLAAFAVGAACSLPVFAGFPGFPNEPPEALATPRGIVGADDNALAATLVVPFFETGINAAADPEDTLLVIANRSDAARWTHYEVWNTNGETAEIFDSILIPARASVSLSMRDLVASAPPSSRAEVTEGAFYRGFVTIDHVTESTDSTPVADSYPFSNLNVLTGWIYYTRLSEGSSNGLPMMHVEHVGSGIDSCLRNFYVNDDGRESLDVDARNMASTQSRINSSTPADSRPDCFATDADFTQEMIFRKFLGGPLNGRTRVVVFAWTPVTTGGPSVSCQMTGLCPDEVDFQHVNEAGTVTLEGTVPLTQVVTVIDLPNTGNGYYVLYRVPDIANSTQIYGFSFNSADPGSAALNWDAIFPATLVY
jgi:hypothetical protein